MKRWLATVLCMVLLLSLCACGGAEEATIQSEYDRAVGLIAEGKYTDAYAALKASSDPRAAEELAKFAFVPLTYQKISPAGHYTHTYTYDAAGYPTKMELVQDHTTYMNIHTYTYAYVDGVRRECRATTVYANGSSSSTFSTYNELGDPLYIACYNDNRLDMEYRYVYNVRGDLLKYTVQSIDKSDNYNVCEEYTYDAQGRPLTHNEIYQDYSTKSTYVYAEDGSYVRHDKVDDTWRNQVNFDPQGRVIRETQTRVGSAEDTPARVFEYRYDAAGNTVFEYSKWEDSVETTTKEYDGAGNLTYSKTLNQDGRATHIIKQAYNEAGQILSKETTTTGFTWDKTTYTYDENGRLVNEYISRPDSMVGRDIHYTYNDNGTLKFLEETGTYGTVSNAYGYDQWGNRVQSLARREWQETNANATWELHYYPKGVPADVVDFAKSLDWE